MRRVQWTNNSTNERSRITAQRLGMVREGLLRSAGVQYSPSLNFVLEGKRWDQEVWSILAEEWPTPEVIHVQNQAPAAHPVSVHVADR
jgi:RimJ/RimL family protein N-acetyltransferase